MYKEGHLVQRHRSSPVLRTVKQGRAFQVSNKGCVTGVCRNADGSGKLNGKQLLFLGSQEAEGTQANTLLRPQMLPCPGERAPTTGEVPLTAWLCTQSTAWTRHRFPPIQPSSTASLSLLSGQVTHFYLCIFDFTALHLERNSPSCQL